MSEDTRRETALVIGDLHLFAKRSDGESVWQSLPQLLTQHHPNYCVFVGDIFDFAWVSVAELPEALQEAVSRIQELLDTHPALRVLYVLGNHDAHEDFIPEIEKLAAENPRLTFAPSHITLRSTFFLHGDICEGRNLDEVSLQRRRQRWLNKPTNNRLGESIYSFLISIRVDQLGGLLLFFPPKVKRRIATFVQKQSTDGPIKHIVFGHTHRRELQTSHLGYTWTNVGAPIGYRNYAPEIIEI